MKKILSYILFVFITATMAQTVEISPFIDKGIFESSTLFTLKSYEGFDSLAATDPLVDKMFVASQLTYPTDYVRAGFTGKLFLDETSHVSAGLWMSITDPATRMIDEDWYGFDLKDGSTHRLKFSHTESRTEGFHFGSAIGYGTELTLLGKPIDFSFSYTFNYMDFEAFGIAYGWNLDTLTTEEQLLDSTDRKFKKKYFNDQNTDLRDHKGNRITESTLVLTYQAFHHSLLFKGEFPLKKWDPVELKTGLQIGPALSYDRDDHPIRGKTTTSVCFGYSIGAALALEFTLSENSSLEVGIYPEYHYTKGTMRQEWYRDEEYTIPETGETYVIPKGTVADDIEAEIIYFNKPLRVQLHYSI